MQPLRAKSLRVSIANDYAHLWMVNGLVDLFQPTEQSENRNNNLFTNNLRETTEYTRKWSTVYQRHWQMTDVVRT